MIADLENIKLRTVAVQSNGETILFRAFVFDNALCSNGLQLKPLAKYACVPESVKDFIAGECTLINPDGEVAASPYEWLLNHGVELEMRINTVFDTFDTKGESLDA